MSNAINEIERELDESSREEFRKYAAMDILERLNYIGTIPWNQAPKYYEFNKLLKKAEK